MNNRRTKSKLAPKAKRPTETKYRLTVASDKLAVLLRLPKTTIKIIDGMAKVNGSKRTSEIYDIIGAHPMLSESMKPLLSSNSGK